MGFFKKIKNAVGGTDAASIDNAVIGRGVIVGVQPTGTSITSGGVEQRVCVFQVEVALDDQTPYMATCRQRIPMWTIAQIQPGATIVAVRVDAADPATVAIDWETPAPTVRLPQAAANGSAADILANGLPCRAIIQQFQPLGMTNPAGLPLYAFALTVVPQDGAAYQIQVGNPVPESAMAFLFPGSQLPAKVMPGEPNSVAIDWAAAVTV
ncbi:hypothetical protein [Desertimonas flava]|jgi:hypothetical protein|uniref:hypothetical protein n=1 Tax=Desertimonas flava TaxID=2064846 RepID=UPI0013C46878|nr:hypothetical protein [Desertimonas flava]